jgi:hypothetical protein
LERSIFYYLRFIFSDLAFMFLFIRNSEIFNNKKQIKNFNSIKPHGKKK